MFFCRETASVELPLGKYGLGGKKASVELLSFSDSSGSPQVKGPKRVSTRPTGSIPFAANSNLVK